MSTPPAGIPAADWSSWPAGARQLIRAQQEEIQALRRENDELRVQLTVLATELASLRERIGCSSRNSSKPPCSDGPGFKPPERRKGRGRKRGGQPGHPGSGPQPLPIERVDEVVEHHPDACRRCGTLLDGAGLTKSPVEAGDQGACPSADPSSFVVNRHRKLHHFRHRKVSHPRPGLGRLFRTGSALAAPAVPLFVHGLRGWLRWLSSVIDAGGTSPAVTPQTSSAG
ncbi:MAG: DUF6444 domain-containing protein, partial [Cyanobacteriota bacterium]